ncbi:YhaN family protein [Alteribacter natronophilus]|uniref:YhaN family protein n=1 Tax=Alteribacter natronophilus TaxID=2583810 RepID=UPI00110D280A|nr:YhaN family protein [Alteribacter natronophilus]TMW73398.1 hypothetical protein FGB90_03585 [Alteribacter natronophilus]
MRYNFINLRAYGHFTDYQLDFSASKGFHFIYGQNEAGKSTVLRAVSNFLYGFPAQTQDSFLHENRKLLIEGEIEKSDGTSMHFLRRKGRKNTLLTPDRKPLDDGTADRFLQGLSRDYFQTMFALNHISLREGGENLLHGDGAGEGLFSAASGISTLRETGRELENEAKNLFLKSGQKPLINKLLRDEKDLTKEAASGQLKIRDWKALREQFEQGVKDIEELTEKLKRTDLEEKRTERILQLLPKAAERSHLKEQVSLLGTLPDLPENCLHILEECRNAIEADSRKIERLKQELESIEEQKQEIHVPDDILDQEDVIVSLYRKSERYEEDVNELPRLQESFSNLAEELGNYLQELLPDAEDISEISRLRISAENRKTVAFLASEEPAVQQKIQNLRGQIEELEQVIADYGRKLEESGDTENAEELKMFFEELSYKGNTARELEKAEEEIRQVKDEIRQQTESLPYWKGSPEDLMNLKVPLLKETIRQAGEDRARLLQLTERKNEQLEQAKGKIKQLRGQISDLESSVKIPSRDDLAKTREKRDRGWLMIRSMLFSGGTGPVKDDIDSYTGGRPLELAYEDSVRTSDATADLMHREAEKVGRKVQLQTALQSAETEAEKLAAEKEDLDTELEKWQDSWEEKWQDSGFPLLTPGEIGEWLGEYETVTGQIRRLKSLQEQSGTLTATLQEQRRSLCTILETEDSSSTFDELLAKAREQMETLQNKANEKENLLNNLENSKRHLEVKKSDLASAELQAEEWKKEWTKAVDGLPLNPDTRPQVVKEILDTYASVLDSFEEYKKTERKIATVSERIDAFESSVEQITEPASAGLKKGQYDTAVNQLHDQLKKANDSRHRLDRLNEKLEETHESLYSAENSLGQAEEKLNRLLTDSGCSDAEELIKTESLCRQKAKLEEKIDSLETQMIAIGHGQSLTELLKEIPDSDRETLSFRLDELKAERQELESRRTEVVEQFGVVKHNYTSAKEGAGNTAARYEEEKQVILTQLETAAEEYVTYKLAAAVLKRGIESFREQNQSPIINRAGELFARLTLGSFTGITIEFNEQDKPILAGTREDGSRVPIAGMSDGSTDQLYLALRIASIEKYVKNNEPVPFIVDDILVHFDDDRSRETLKVLIELSELTQVIFFSHHHRLKSLLEETADSDRWQFISLSSSPVYAD